LYLSTIETLAMAIDAKDQVTHGHIRRVQAHATNLAKEFGVRDESLLKAIEAAALLHDMGKLAVPEYILNKPGKLTAAEFEKMKLHASVGADILSAIDFPYPVVPIVRHHHENWDGTGYPTGIKGTEIPLGARILAVVDCFDALTSDRPYRPRLSDEAALAILKQRRGTMYDPVIVDTFFRVHATMPKEPERKGPASEVLNTITYSGRAPVTDCTTAHVRTVTLYELVRALAGQTGVDEATDVIARYLQQRIPASLCAFYFYDDGTDELDAQRVVGIGSSALKGMRIPLGQRLSGWVAANRQPILNSDAALDLGNVDLGITMRSCLSSAMVADDALIGVLTLYSTEDNGFDDAHRRIVDVAASHIAYALKAATHFDGASQTNDSLDNLVSLNRIQQFVVESGLQNLDQKSQFSLVSIGVVGLDRLTLTYGRGARDAALSHVMRHSASCLRSGDILLRHGADEFAALLNETNQDAATAIANRIHETVRQHPLHLSEAVSITIDVFVTNVNSPGEGRSLLKLIDSAGPTNLSDSVPHGSAVPVARRSNS